VGRRSHGYVKLFDARLTADPCKTVRVCSPYVQPYVNPSRPCGSTQTLVQLSPLGIKPLSLHAGYVFAFAAEFPLPPSSLGTGPLSGTATYIDERIQWFHKLSIAKCHSPRYLSPAGYSVAFQVRWEIVPNNLSCCIGALACWLGQPTLPFTLTVRRRT